jgi:hypothetical protein
VRPEITLIKKSGPNPVMSKRIFLDEQADIGGGSAKGFCARGLRTRWSVYA